MRPGAPRAGRGAHTAGRSLETLGAGDTWGPSEPSPPLSDGVDVSGAG